MNSTKGWCLQIVQQLWPGDEKEQLKRMNLLIDEQNEKDPSHHIVRWERQHFWAFVAIIVLNGLEQRNPEHLWQRPKYNVINPTHYAPILKNYFKSYDQFKRCRQLFHRIFESEELQESGDDWWRVRKMVDLMNENRQRVYKSSMIKTLDESVAWYYPQTTKDGHLPHISKEDRKPKGLGYEMKNACCGVSGVMLYQEMLEGEEAMQQKRHCHGMLGS